MMYSKELEEWENLIRGQVFTVTGGLLNTAINWN